MSTARTSVSSGESVVLANVSRRRFLEGMSLGGLVLAVGLPSIARAQEPKKYGADGMPNGWTDNPLVFVSVGEDGTVTIVCHRSEMGQGVRTGMPMIVADELEADWKPTASTRPPSDMPCRNRRRLTLATTTESSPAERSTRSTTVALIMHLPSPRPA